MFLVIQLLLMKSEYEDGCQMSSVALNQLTLLKAFSVRFLYMFH